MARKSAKKYKTLPPNDNNKDDEDYESDQSDSESDSDEEYKDYDESELVSISSTLKRKNPTYYKRFVKARDIIKNREISIQNILACNISDEKRATLLERYECLKNIEPCTEEYLEMRDRIRAMYYKSIADMACDTSSSSSVPIASNLLKKLTDAEAEVSKFKERLKNLTCSDHTRKIIEEKIDDFDENMKGDEKSKLKRWINAALSLPFNKLSVNPQLTTLGVDGIIKKSKEFLDKKLYGMKNVKERLMLFLNKKLREGGSRGCNIALVGKPGVGKCLHPDTPVMMFDLSIKKAKDIVEGDVLLGDDQTSRRVLSTVKGQEEMFEIEQQYGESYIVNKSHILSVRNRLTGEVNDVQLTDIIGKEWVYTPYSCRWDGTDTCYKPYEMGLFYGKPLNDQSRSEFKGVYDYPLDKNYKNWTYTSKQSFIQGLIDGTELHFEENDVMNVYVPKSTPILSIIDLIRSMGKRCIYNQQKCCLQIYQWNNNKSNMDEKFSIRSIGMGDYCGFVIDGNRRFVLADWTVTHNTAIAKALSECLQIPFAQVNFGGVANAEFLTGHDYTYVGSCPGEISRCLTRMNSKNGILFFDEFDKATDKKDIMSTLLHVTDFSQNNEFRDNYFPELSQDLSKIWFIYSMNQLPSDPAMLDRLEVINVDEYTSEERELIARDYLFPKYMSELKINDKIKVTEKGIKAIVNLSSGNQPKKGVRDLERCINIVIEKIYFYLHNKGDYSYKWYKSIKNNDVNGQIVIDDKMVEEVVGDSKKQPDVFLNMYA
jgi:hypothetical protein